MKPIDLLDAATLAPFIGCLERRNFDVQPHLERQQICPDMVYAGDGTLARRQVWNFFADIEEREGFHTLGFLDGDALSISDLGAFGQNVMKAVTLRDAILSFQRLLPTLVHDNDADLQSGPNNSWFRNRSSRMPAYAKGTDHATLVILLEVIRLALGPQWTPTHVCLQTEETDIIKQIPDFANAKVTFNRTHTGVMFPTEWLSKPLLNPPTISAASYTMDGPQEISIDESVSRMITALLPFRDIPSAETMAEMLGVSRMTLHNGLKTNGTSYRLITERIRFESAKKMLQNSSSSIKEIAHELGYSSSTNFIRAFHHMTGQTPKQFRLSRQG